MDSSGYDSESETSDQFRSEASTPKLRDPDSELEPQIEPEPESKPSLELVPKLSTVQRLPGKNLETDHNILDEAKTAPEETATGKHEEITHHLQVFGIFLLLNLFITIMHYVCLDYAMRFFAIQKFTFSKLKLQKQNVNK